jgi:hypothetical protein
LHRTMLLTSNRRRVCKLWRQCRIKAMAASRRKSTLRPRHIPTRLMLKTVRIGARWLQPSRRCPRLPFTTCRRDHP